MKNIAFAAVAALTLGASPLVAQSTATPPPPVAQAPQPPAPLPGILQEVKTMYANVQNNIVKAAEQFPAENWAGSRHRRCARGRA